MHKFSFMVLDYSGSQRAVGQDWSVDFHPIGSSGSPREPFGKSASQESQSFGIVGALVNMVQSPSDRPKPDLSRELEASYPTRNASADTLCTVKTLNGDLGSKG